MKIYTRLKIILFFSQLIFSTQIFAKKYTLVIEPTYPINQAKEVYEPLRKWLSKETKLDIELVIEKNYYTYWLNTQKETKVDFTFDAPQIAAYRVKNKNHKALATTVEPLSFHLISLEEPDEGETVQDFMVSKKIVMLPSPSLATIYFKEWFTDLFAAPMKDITALSWQECVEIVFDQSAQAAIVPDWMFELYPNFSSLIQSKQIPGSTFTASPDVPEEIVEKFQSVLLSMKDNNLAYDVLVELNTEGFKKPNILDYQGLTEVLPNR